VARRAASMVVFALLSVAPSVQIEAWSATPGGVRVDPAVVPAGGDGCRHCGGHQCAAHAGRPHAGHHADCRPGQCVPYCPVRPAQFGFYGTQWRRWPGSGVVPASGVEDVTPDEPPRSQVPGPDEESPRVPEEEDTPQKSDQPAIDQPAIDQPPAPEPRVPNIFDTTPDADQRPAAEPVPALPDPATAEPGPFDDATVAPDATAPELSAIVLPARGEPGPLPAADDPRPVGEPAAAGRGWRSFLRSPSAPVAPAHFQPEAPASTAAQRGHSTAAPRGR